MQAEVKYIHCRKGVGAAYLSNPNYLRVDPSLAAVERLPSEPASHPTTVH
jgi:hypothetical protein